MTYLIALGLIVAGSGITLVVYALGWKAGKAHTFREVARALHAKGITLQGEP